MNDSAPSPPPLSDSQLREFAREGCLIVPGAVDDGVLAALRRDFAARVDVLLRRARALGAVAGDGGYAGDGGGHGDGDRAAADDFSAAAARLICGAPGLYQHLDISLPLDGDLAARLPAWRELFGDDWRAHAGVFIPDSVYRLLTHPRLVAIARQVLRADDLVASPVQHIRIKPPQRDLPAGADTDATVARANWHQDEAVVHEGARGVDILTVWVAVTESTVANGCLRCVPGSHLAADDARRPDFGLRAHCPGRVFVGDIYIPDATIPAAARRDLEVSPGDAILLHRRTIHGAGANESDGIRWSFDLRYQRAGSATGRECFPVLRLPGGGDGAISRHPRSLLSGGGDGGADAAGGAGEVAAGAARYRRDWLAARDAILRGEVAATFNTRWLKYRGAGVCA